MSLKTVSSSPKPEQEEGKGIRRKARDEESSYRVCAGSGGVQDSRDSLWWARRSGHSQGSLAHLTEQLCAPSAQKFKKLSSQYHLYHLSCLLRANCCLFRAAASSEPRRSLTPSFLHTAWRQAILIMLIRHDLPFCKLVLMASSPSVPVSVFMAPQRE